MPRGRSRRVASDARPPSRPDGRIDVGADELRLAAVERDREQSVAGRDERGRVRGAHLLEFQARLGELDRAVADDQRVRVGVEHDRLIADDAQLVLAELRKLAQLGLRPVSATATARSSGTSRTPRLRAETATWAPSPNSAFGSVSAGFSCSSRRVGQPLLAGRREDRRARRRRRRCPRARAAPSMRWLSVVKARIVDSLDGAHGRVVAGRRHRRPADTSKAFEAVADRGIRAPRSAD